MKILLTLALLLAACRPPAPSAPRPDRVVRVAVEDGLDWTAWRDDQRAAIERYLPTLSRVGVQWTIARESEADVLVRSWDAGAGCLDGAARYVVGYRYVEVDAACVGGLDGLRYMAGHELLHQLTWSRYRWLGHVCRFANETTDCHPTVRGKSLLNPYVAVNATGEEGWINTEPTEVDRELLAALSRGTR